MVVVVVVVVGARCGRVPGAPRAGDSVGGELQLVLAATVLSLVDVAWTCREAIYRRCSCHCVGKDLLHISHGGGR